jgi:steroid 5-alpha reductase family enzyme
MDWGGLGATVVLSAVVVLVCVVGLWVIGVRINDVSIIDIFWGLGFAVIALVTLIVGTGPIGRRALLLVMAGTWGVRLGGYLFWRNHGKGEDRRYTAMRRHVGDGFNRYALVRVFLFQGLMMWIVSLPIQVGGNLTRDRVFTPVALIGVVVWVVGLSFEAIGDAQLARFKANATNAGAVMDRGLWRYTRHPNYFGDACVWWGIWLVVAGMWPGTLTVFGPALMTFLLVRVTGKALLERRLGRSRPGYAEYVARTGGFIPRPPRRRVGTTVT